jgi:hypothetical protein
MEHLLQHQNPGAYKVVKDTRKGKGDKKEIALYCIFPGCEKAKGGDLEMVHTSSGYSNHIKMHTDPTTGKCWLPPPMAKNLLQE